MASEPPSRRIAPLALLETAVLSSGIGNGAASVAIPWLVLERTGKASAAGIVGAATALPLLASALFSGSIVDTFGRRRISIVSDVLSAISVALIPVADRFLGLDLTLIIALAVLGAVFDPAGATAREAMLPELGVEAGWKLPRTNAVHEATWGISYLIGPALGGVLIAAIGAVNTLWVTSIGFVLASVAAAFIRASSVGTPEKADRPETVLAGSAEGVRLVFRDPLLRATVLFSMLFVTIYLPIEGVILPYMFERQGRPAALGFVLTALSVGSILGALGFAAIGGRFRRYPVFVGATILASLSIVGMALSPTYVALVASAGLAGLFWGPVDPLINTAMQTRIEPARRGRALGVLMAAYYAAGPVGYLGIGFVVERAGAEEAFLGLGLGILAVALAGAFTPALRLFDAPPLFAIESTMPTATPVAGPPLGCAEGEPCEE